MRIVKAYSLGDDEYHEYEVPSMAEALKYSKQTFDVQFDKIEGKEVRGGLPMLWNRKD